MSPNQRQNEPRAFDLAFAFAAFAFAAFGAAVFDARSGVAWFGVGEVAF